MLKNLSVKQSLKTVHVRLIVLAFSMGIVLYVGNLSLPWQNADSNSYVTVSVSNANSSKDVTQFFTKKDTLTASVTDGAALIAALVIASFIFESRQYLLETIGLMPGTTPSVKKKGAQKPVRRTKKRV